MWVSGSLNLNFGRKVKIRSFWLTGKGFTGWLGCCYRQVGVVLRYTFTMLPLLVKDTFRPWKPCIRENSRVFVERYHNSCSHFKIQNTIKKMQSRFDTGMLEVSVRPRLTGCGVFHSEFKRLFGNPSDWFELNIAHFGIIKVVMRFIFQLSLNMRNKLIYLSLTVYKFH